ncbi:hypothetical protein FISHEDRAFT_56438 [Fistulina hepatica ATCC 64428]|uniref:Uncharacterized protein n=1 Tax=Fistulina hepatica ATCC 64428 TaxID=1128425 RepID=A0A0D7AKD6_9AGAR|nr:hypothetical protein FISHEDRAFT_56438 [Fistulina hepatica ATCC 64428]
MTQRNHPNEERRQMQGVDEPTSPHTGTDHDDDDDDSSNSDEEAPTISSNRLPQHSKKQLKAYLVTHTDDTRMTVVTHRVKLLTNRRVGGRRGYGWEAPDFQHDVLWRVHILRAEIICAAVPHPDDIMPTVVACAHMLRHGLPALGNLCLYKRANGMRVGESVWTSGQGGDSGRLNANLKKKLDKQKRRLVNAAQGSQTMKQNKGRKEQHITNGKQLSQESKSGQVAHFCSQSLPLVTLLPHGSAGPALNITLTYRFPEMLVRHRLQLAWCFCVPVSRMESSVISRTKSTCIL